MHIICEGSKTEPYYLRGYIDEHASDKARLISVPNVKYNTPVALVNEAIKLKDSENTTDDDEIWVVYDRESVAKYPHSLHHQAWDLAKSKGINIALSNVCFEVWILQHFNFCSAPYSCFEDLKRNSTLKENMLSVGVTDYDKADKHLYSKIKKGIPNARKRAKALNKQSLEASIGDLKPFQLNSYTNINELLDAIDSFEPK